VLVIVRDTLNIGHDVSLDNMGENRGSYNRLPVELPTGVTVVRTL
jgi:hypothetical protein